jgi:hypothetical protein
MLDAWQVTRADSSSPSSVEIRHNGRRAVTLRNAAAQKFLVDVEVRDPQHLMARLTGNYRRGNERTPRKGKGKG